MKIAVVGTGYVGLVAGTCFAEGGNDVICVDIDEEKIATLNQGKVPIYEPGLEEMIHRNVADRRLSFTTDIAPAVRKAEVIFIAVGTPQGQTGRANLEYVRATARSIAKAMNGRKIIVTKSTVPVGTSDEIRAIIKSGTKYSFAVLSNPEFMKEGAAVEDFMKPDRVVLGGDDFKAIEKLKELYEPFVRTGNPITVMDARSAEMCKYAANAILATKISFINEVARLCEKMGADIGEVRRAISLDRRIGPYFIFPGTGYGGSCFPKDVRAMIGMGGKEVEMPLLRAVEKVNERQKRLLVDKVTRFFGAKLSGKTFAVWGLAFKPRTDDMREAPAIAIIERLLELGATVRAYDPEATVTARRLFGDRITLCEKSYDALAGADALAIVTEWNEFREPNFARMRELMRQPVVFDGRNIYSPEQMRALGFTYVSIGR